jgi:hypothetical protein
MPITLTERIELESKKEFINIRNSEDLQRLLHEAREILDIPHDRFGADPETIRKSLKFVKEFDLLVWGKFINDYPPMLREFIKKRMG